MVLLANGVVGKSAHNHTMNRLHRAGHLYLYEHTIRFARVGGMEIYDMRLPAFCYA